MDIKTAVGKDGKITITVTPATNPQPSASGKSLTVASTRGNVSIEGTDMKLGLNIYKPIKN